MESIIGLIIWVIIIMVIIFRTIRQAGTHRVPTRQEWAGEGAGAPEKREKEDELKRLFETMFTGEHPEEERIPEEQEEVEVVEPQPQISVPVQQESKIPEPVAEVETILPVEPAQKLEEFQIPKDLRQAIILREIIGPPKG